jgi:predicted nuclease of restriction endonuclease-like (RecB) superfamily
LTKLENDEKKIRLINSCIKNNWSTRQLDNKIDAKLKELAVNSKTSLIRKTSSYLKAIDKFPELEASFSEKGTSMLDDLKPKQRENLEKKLNALKAGAEEISKKSEALTSFCDTLLDGLAAAAAKDQSGGEQDKEVSEKSES